MFGFSLISRVWKAAVASPPVLTSSNYGIGDPGGGGQPIVLTGSGFTGVSGAAGVTFLGTNATSYVVDSDTQITAVLPAHATGSGNIVVTHPTNGASNNLAFEYWSPAQITGITRVWDANKGVTTAGGGAVSAWLDQVSSDNATQGVNANRPVQTASVFGTMPSLRFTPEQWLDCSIGEGPVSPFSFFAVIKSTSSTGAGSASNPTYNPARSILGGGGWSGFGMDGGAIAYKSYDVALESWGTVNDGNPHLIGVTSSVIPTRQGYKDGSAVGAATSLGGTPDAYYDHIGDGYLNTDGWSGDVGAIIVLGGTLISNGELTKLNSWSKQRWGTP